MLAKNRHKKKKTSQKYLSLVGLLGVCHLSLVTWANINLQSFLLLVRNEEDDAPAVSTKIIDLARNPFCNSLRGALARGPSDRKMIHAFVANVGHFPFLHNVLLTMIHSEMPWKPLVLSIGAGVCPMLANVSELQGRFLCVPYLERHFRQLKRDEPDSVKQIEKFLLSNNNSTNEHDNNTRFGNIDHAFHGWGSVEHKFLINTKLYALRDILDCGADAFITDTDIGFREDPRPYFSIDGPKGGIVAQNDTNAVYQLSLNSGFMYWKRTRQNIDLINDIITVPPFWHIDQARVNTRMHNRSTPHTLLDAFKFPNGAIYSRHPDGLEDAVVFHANWNSGRAEKEKMLRGMSLWLLPNEAAS